jgi:uncharacterized protein YlzI (FlbEa/FlbD family)
MKFIKVTNLNGDPIFINPQYIGHMYEVKEKIDYGSVTKPRHTRMGVVTHNNGGFEVKETPQEIMKKIIP